MGKWSAVLLLSASPCFAQVPAGPEFMVNTTTANWPRIPSIAFDHAGNFVVVWGTMGWYSYAFGQRYDASGSPSGGEFKVNASPTTHPIPTVASGKRGEFTVLWIAQWESPGYFVVGQRYDATGSPLGRDFRVSTGNSSWLTGPSAASDQSGNFTAVWNDEAIGDVFGQRYDASGLPRGHQFQVNSYGSSIQRSPAVAADAAGNVVVVWESVQDGSGLSIFAQRYAPSGAPLASEFRVNTFTAGHQRQPQVAFTGPHRFVVVWNSEGEDGSGDGIFGQRFLADGTRLGSEFQVNTTAYWPPHDPWVASDANGNFVVSWLSDFHGVLGQRFDASGAKRGREFRIHTVPALEGYRPVIASDEVGNLGSSWTGIGIRGQRFGWLFPRALAVDTAGNGVLEPGESVDLQPSWRNLNESRPSHTFAGRATDLAGPAGAAYSITDGTADYGDVAYGSTRACDDCYEVSVSSPPLRPVPHWDASVIETITPDRWGQSKRWILHVGDSFSDVERSSPFYRFVETLLHRGVTQGCGGTRYCPANPTTREQMPVLVLLGKEGGGYIPPACATPLFDDVPASNPSCPYIEELARRGVVSGCGGGDYCPSDAVTREQMAVFVLLTLDGALDPPPCGRPMFADVPQSSPFCRWIEELARRGVVAGCGGPNFCPTSPVTRDQMAVFVSETFSLNLYGP